MELKTTMRPKRAIAAFAALILTGCAYYSEDWYFAQGYGLVRPATIVALDQTSREVTLQAEEDGETFTVTAGSRVRNLRQLAVGDRVKVWYEPSNVIIIDYPADASTFRGEYETMHGASMTPFVVATFVSHNGILLLRTPDGSTIPFELDPIQLGHKPGDRVLVSMTESRADKIVEVTQR